VADGLPEEIQSNVPEPNSNGARKTNGSHEPSLRTPPTDFPTPPLSALSGYRRMRHLRSHPNCLLLFESLYLLRNGNRGNVTVRSTFLCWIAVAHGFTDTIPSTGKGLNR